MNHISKSTISACMIVKDEEEFLPNCLNSIKNAVDEIIVVNTGSTDNTVSIAKNFGAQVYHYPWNDSFSEARNHAIRHATKDWIFMIDADEELEQADIPVLRQAIRSQRYNGVIIAIYSKIRDGSMHKFYYTRVFRRGKARYKDIIHEQIIVEGERLLTEIRLYHHGYNLDPSKMQVKWQKTTQLLQKQIEQNKTNSFAWFNLIRNYRTQELFQRGVDTGLEALKFIAPEKDIQHYIMIVYEIANCHLNIGNIDESKKLCYTILSKLKKLNVTPENIDIVYTLACTYLKEGNCNKAINYFNRYLELRKLYLINTNMSLLTDTLGYDYSAFNGLGFCYGKLNDWVKAINYFWKALDANPQYLTTYKNLASCYSVTGNIEEAVNTLLKSVNLGIADHNVFLRLGELNIKRQEYKAAVVYLEKYLILCPEDKNALLNISQCYEKLGHENAARIGYRSVYGKNERFQ